MAAPALRSRYDSSALRRRDARAAAMLVDTVADETGPMLCDFLSSFNVPLPPAIWAIYSLIRDAAARCHAYSPMHEFEPETMQRALAPLVNVEGVLLAALYGLIRTF